MEPGNPNRHFLHTLRAHEGFLKWFCSLNDRGCGSKDTGQPYSTRLLVARFAFSACKGKAREKQGKHVRRSATNAFTHMGPGPRLVNDLPHTHIRRRGTLPGTRYLLFYHNRVPHPHLLVLLVVNESRSRIIPVESFCPAFSHMQRSTGYW